MISAAFTLALVLPLLAGSMVQMVVIMLIAGLPIAPSFAITYNLIEAAAVPGTQAEVFGWISTSITLTIAFGTAVGGSLIAHVDVHAALVLASWGPSRDAALGPRDILVQKLAGRGRYVGAGRVWRAPSLPRSAAAPPNTRSSRLAGSSRAGVRVTHDPGRRPGRDCARLRTAADRDGGDVLVAPRPLPPGHMHE